MNNNTNCLLQSARQKVNNYNKNNSSNGPCCGFRDLSGGIQGPTGPTAPMT